MAAYYHRDQYADVNLLQLPTTVGRRLDVGGFVFTDSIDAFLKNLSEQYLIEAWSQLVVNLERYHIDPLDLVWGVPHPGETRIPGVNNSEPHHFIGWTNQKLADFYEEDKFGLLDKQLAKQTPQLRCVATWRSHQWDIAPTNFRLALRLIEAVCTGEITHWHPAVALSTYKKVNQPWLKVVKAVSKDDQAALDLALQEAKTKYSPVGYPIVLLSMHNLLQSGYDLENSKLQLPDAD